jgi:hypothetical protein
MGAPFTQVEIQTEIDFYKDQMRVATKSQEYSYDEGPIGQFGLKKGKLKEIKEALQYWLDLMKEYYPDAYTTQPQIHFNEIGFLNG